MSSPSSGPSKRIQAVLSQRHRAAEKLTEAERIPPIVDGPYGGVKYARGTANEDESNLQHYAGNFTKGLEHCAETGLIKDPTHYDNLVDALTDRNDDTAFPSAANGLAAIDSAYAPALDRNFRKLVNPLAGVAGDITGIDAPSMSIPAAPGLGTQRAAAEMVELYWMSELRDVPFDEMAQHKSFQAATAELNKLNQNATEPFAQHYIGGRPDTAITPSTVFRGSAAGNDQGGYISQFLLKDVSFGTLDFEQKQKNLKYTGNYMTDRQSWLAVQNGADTSLPRSDLEYPDTGRHIVTFRDLAHYVHFDALHQAYFNAALILDGSALSSPNPYLKSTGQEGFGTMGGPHVLVAVTEVATRALKAIWQQKWYVHRRLRPEAMGARVEYDQHTLIDAALLNSSALAQSASNNNSCLLPMVFPEGSPMHPSYGAGHATVAGACVTILKAFFDTSQTIRSPVRAVLLKSGGTRLIADNSLELSVGGELNKLAANIAIGRNGAGVHYRTDYTASMALGELVALSMLQEQAMFMRESSAKDVAFSVERFDGTVIEICYDGSVKSPAAPYDAALGIGTVELAPDLPPTGKSRQRSWYAD